MSRKPDDIEPNYYKTFMLSSDSREDKFKRRILELKLLKSGQLSNIVVNAVSAPVLTTVQSNYEAGPVHKSADDTINHRFDREPLAEAAHTERIGRSKLISKQRVPVGYNNASGWFGSGGQGGGPGEHPRTMFLDAGLMLLVTISASLVPR